MTSIKRFLVSSHWLLASQLGFDGKRLFRFMRELPRFAVEFGRFRRLYGGSLRLRPCLHDRSEQGGTVRSEYFWQDLLVARWIHAAEPKRHVDIGSRVDGFVAHVASFRDIEVFDVRPIATPIEGVVFKQVDVMNRTSVPITASGYCDSLSCLHALEHFGLGRYGDTLDPNGHEKGIENMAALLEPGGTFYLSTPVGRERVEFNANRVFDPRGLVQSVERHGLALQRLTLIGSGGSVEHVALDAQTFHVLASQTYRLGLFVFRKT